MDGVLGAMADGIAVALPVLVGFVLMGTIIGVLRHTLFPYVAEQIAERDTRVARERAVQARLNDPTEGTVLNGERVEPERRLPKWRRMF